MTDNQNVQWLIVNESISVSNQAERKHWSLKSMLVTDFGDKF